MSARKCRDCCWSRPMTGMMRSAAMAVFSFAGFVTGTDQKTKRRRRTKGYWTRLRNSCLVDLFGLFFRRLVVGARWQRLVGGGGSVQSVTSRESTKKKKSRKEKGEK